MLLVKFYSNDQWSMPLKIISNKGVRLPSWKPVLLFGIILAVKCSYMHKKKPKTKTRTKNKQTNEKPEKKQTRKTRVEKFSQCHHTFVKPWVSCRYWPNAELQIKISPQDVYGDKRAAPELQSLMLTNGCLGRGIDCEGALVLTLTILLISKVGLVDLAS